MIDEELAAPQIGEPRERIVTHRVMNQDQVALGWTQILQPPDPLRQCRVHVFDKNIGLEAEAHQHRLHEEHTIRDRIDD